MILQVVDAVKAPAADLAAVWLDSIVAAKMPIQVAAKAEGHSALWTDVQLLSRV